jgi:hypothetical protein
VNPNDASPTLPALALAAFAHGIEVVSCDLEVGKVVDQLHALHPNDGPFNHSSAISPRGEAIRDQHAAKTIDDYRRANPDKHLGLLVFGAGHFEANEARGAAPLPELIRAKGIPCDVDN